MALGVPCQPLCLFFSRHHLLWVPPTPQNNRARYAYAVAVAFLVALLTFPAHFTRLPYRSVINDMFSSAGGENSMDAWDSPSPFLSLVLFMVREMDGFGWLPCLL